MVVFSMCTATEQDSHFLDYLGVDHYEVFMGSSWAGAATVNMGAKLTE